jgi:hypothetical protein
MTVGKFQTHDAKKFQFVYYCVCHWNDVKEVTDHAVAEFKGMFRVNEPCTATLQRDITLAPKFKATASPASEFYEQHLSSLEMGGEGFLICDGCGEILTKPFEKGGELLQAFKPEIFHCETQQKDLCENCFDPTLLKSFDLVIYRADGISLIGVYSVSLHSPPTQASASETVPAAKRARTTDAAAAADDAASGLPPAAKRALTTDAAAAADDAASGLLPAAKRARTTDAAAAADDAASGLLPAAKRARTTDAAVATDDAA